MRLVFLGPPGIGKGTYASAISRKYGIPHISTGDIFREEIRRGSDLGIKIRGYVERGELVPDDVVIEVVRRRLAMEDCSRGFILDGYPRTLRQAEALDGMARIDLALNFVAPDEVIVERISGRRICPACGAIYHVRFMPPRRPGICDRCGGELIQREDDRPEVVRRRLELYRARFAPIIELYRARGLLVDVDASEEADRVIPRILRVLEAHGFPPPGNGDLK